MLHFFRSAGYICEALYEQWVKIAVKHSNLVRISDRAVLLGDHIKIPKEGRHMPDIKILRQDSQNSSKPKYIAGHNYGQVSAVITNEKISRSLPLMTELQMSPPNPTETEEHNGDSLVVQMINLVNKTARIINEPVVVALDAYFSSRAAWSAADTTIMPDSEKLVEIVTRAQINTVGYNAVVSETLKKRGRPRKYGDRVVLYELFSDMSGFIETNMTLYGKKTRVEYQCLDLFWKPVQRLVRFVMVDSGNGRCVLMSTSLTISAEDIITIYALRFKIETSFDEQKNEVGSFTYHFWTTAMPKSKKRKIVDLPEDTISQRRIRETRKATQTFVCMATIATGILTIIAFTHNSQIWDRYTGWLRTLRSIIPTVVIVKETLAQDFHVFCDYQKELPSFNLVAHLRRNNDYLFQDVA